MLLLRDFCCTSCCGFILILLNDNAALLSSVRSRAPAAACRPLGISPPGERGGQQRKGMINHAQIPQACLGEYMSPPGGSLWEITPLPLFSFSVLIEHNPLHEIHDTATVEEA